ncbi:MAG: hypothetical protein Tsb0018_01060 [Opitutales bacterium]|tara:strand:- start:342 stop:728 length:387 start_codon:yes stop_codon:yes gene_type:complete
MIEGIGLDGGNYVAAKKMMDLIDLNHRANTTNIAHLETPKFQRVQVKEGEKTDFARYLENNELSKLQSMEFSLEHDPNAKAVRPDGNTVDLEKEVMTMTTNALDHDLVSRYLTDSLLRVKTAITGKNI